MICRPGRIRLAREAEVETGSVCNPSSRLPASLPTATQKASCTLPSIFIKTKISSSCFHGVIGPP